MTKTLRKKIATILVFSLCFGIFAGNTIKAEAATYSYSYSYDKVDNRTIKYDDGIVTLTVGAKNYTLCVRDYAAEEYVFCDQYGTAFCVTQGGYLAWANPEIQFGMTSFVNWNISGEAVKATSLQCMGSSKNVATHYYDNYLVLHELPSFRDLYYSVYDKYPEETPKPTVTPSAKPTEEPVATPTVTPSAKPTEEPVATPTVAPSAKPTEEPAATITPNATPSAKPEKTPAATVTPSATSSAKPSQKPVATVTPSVNPTATPICGCMNGGLCICPNGTCVCVNCPCKDKLCRPIATTTTTSSSSSSYKKVKPKTYHTATKAGKRLKLWKVTQWVKDGKIKTSKKLMSICIFDRKKGKIQWNGYKRKAIKTCQFTNKKRWLVGITTKGKLKLYPSGNQTNNPKTMKGVYVAVKCNSNGLATAGVKKNGKVVKLKY